MNANQDPGCAQLLKALPCDQSTKLAIIKGGPLSCESSQNLTTKRTTLHPEDTLEHPSLALNYSGHCTLNRATSAQVKKVKKA